jgi:methyl-accepting chemotaxis protein
VATNDKIVQEIELEGAEKVQQDFRQTGAAGEQAFNQMGKAAEQTNFDALSASVSQVLQATRNLLAGVDKLTQAMQQQTAAVANAGAGMDTYAQATDAAASTTSRAADAIGKTADETTKAGDAFKRTGDEIQGSFQKINSVGSGFSLTGIFLGGVAVVTALSAAINSLANASATAIDGLADLASASGATIGQMAGLESEITRLDDVFSKLQSRIDSVWPVIQKSVADAATTIARDTLSVASAYQHLEGAELKMEQANNNLAKSFLSLSKTQLELKNIGANLALQEVSNANSIEGAVLGIVDAEIALLKLQGKNVSPARLKQHAIEKAELAIAEAELRLQQASQKAREDAEQKRLKIAQAQQAAADAALARQASLAQIASAELAREKAVLDLAEARKKQDEDRKNSIGELVKFVDNLAAGFETAGNKVNATVDNIVKGIIASVGAGVKGIGSLGSSLGELGAVGPKVLPVMLKLADVLKNIQDDATRNAVGRALGLSQEQITNLKQGSAAILEEIQRLKELGLAYTEAEKAGAQALVSARSALGDTLTLLKNKIGALFAPSVTGKLEWIKEMAEGLGSLLFKFIEAEKAKKQLLSGGTGEKFDPFKDLDLGEIQKFLKENGWEKLADAIGVVREISAALGNVWTNVLIPAGNAVIAALKSLAEIINSTLGTKLTASDVGIASILVFVLGGVNSLILALGVLFGLSGPGFEKMASLLEGFGINVKKIRDAFIEAGEGVKLVIQQMLGIDTTKSIIDGLVSAIKLIPVALAVVIVSFSGLRRAAIGVAAVLSRIFGVEITGGQVALVGIIGQMTGAFKGLGGILVGVGAALQIIVAAGTILGGVFLFLARLNPFIAIATVIIALTADMSTLGKIAETSFNVIVGAITEVRFVATKLAEAINAIFGTDVTSGGVVLVGLGLLAVALTSVREKAILAGTALLTMIPPQLRVALAALAAVMGVVGDDVTRAKNSGDVFGDKMGELNKALGEGKISAEAYAEAMRKIHEVADRFDPKTGDLELFKTKLDEIFKTVQAGAPGAANTVKEMVDGWLKESQRAKDGFSNIPGAAANAATQAGSKVLETLRTTGQQISTEGQKIGDNFGKVINIADELKKQGKTAQDTLNSIKPPATLPAEMKKTLSVPPEVPKSVDELQGKVDGLLKVPAPSKNPFELFRVNPAIPQSIDDLGNKFKTLKDKTSELGTGLNEAGNQLPANMQLASGRVEDLVVKIGTAGTSTEDIVAKWQDVAAAIDGAIQKAVQFAEATAKAAASGEGAGAGAGVDEFSSQQKKVAAGQVEIEANSRRILGTQQQLAAAEVVLAAAIRVSNQTLAEREGSLQRQVRTQQDLGAAAAAAASQAAAATGTQAAAATQAAQAGQQFGQTLQVAAEGAQRVSQNVAGAVIKVRDFKESMRAAQAANDGLATTSDKVEGNLGGASQKAKSFFESIRDADVVNGKLVGRVDGWNSAMTNTIKNYETIKQNIQPIDVASGKIVSTVEKGTQNLQRFAQTLAPIEVANGKIVTSTANVATNVDKMSTASQAAATQATTLSTEWTKVSDKVTEAVNKIVESQRQGQAGAFGGLNTADDLKGLEDLTRAAGTVTETVDKIKTAAAGANEGLTTLATGANEGTAKLNELKGGITATGEAVSQFGEKASSASNAFKSSLTEGLGAAADGVQSIWDRLSSGILKDIEFIRNQINQLKGLQKDIPTTPQATPQRAAGDSTNPWDQLPQSANIEDRRGEIASVLDTIGQVEDAMKRALASMADFVASTNEAIGGIGTAFQQVSTNVNLLSTSIGAVQLAMELVNSPLEKTAALVSQAFDPAPVTVFSMAVSSVDTFLQNMVMNLQKAIQLAQQLAAVQLKSPETAAPATPAGPAAPGAAAPGAAAASASAAGLQQDAVALDALLAKIQQVTVALQGLTTATTQVAAAMATAFLGAGAALTQSISAAVQQVSSDLSSLGSIATSAMSALTSAVGSASSSLQGVQSALQGIGSAVQQAFDSGPVNAFAQAMEGVVQAIQQVISTLMTAISAAQQLLALQAAVARGGGGMATGGPVTGAGGVDNVPAWLTSGEWVIRKGAVRALIRQFGQGVMPMINRGRLPVPRFALGGEVPRISMPSLSIGGEVATPSAGSGTPRDLGILHFGMPDGSKRSVRADEDTAAALTRVARRQEIHGMAKPSWYR